MLRSGERVEDTSATTGTGATKTLDGSPPTGRVSFNAAFGNGGVEAPRFTYVQEDASDGANWEVAIGYLSASTTLVREQIIASSNSGSAVDFAGSTRVFEAGTGWQAEQAASRGVALALSRGVFMR